MNKRNYYLILTIIALALGTLGCKPTEESTPPNIIIFFTDDQGYGDLGCYGAQGFQTPNIDRLASQGIRFEQFYVPASVCTPSRAALLTGKYPKRVGLHEAVLYPYSTHGLAPEELTIPELLKPLGYSTACIGKWHLGHHEEFMPNNQGFDYFYGVPYSNDMDGYFYKHNQFQSPPLPVYKNRELVDEGPNQDYLTQMWTKEAVEYIQKNSEAPFFLYLAHNMPHTPWHASEKFRGSSQRGLYGDIIQELDWSMGEIIKTLEEKDIKENTIIIFTSDNGPVTRLKNGGTAGPLRGSKATTWEGGMRVPGIVSWPTKIPAGITCNEPISTLDLLPTLIHLAGGKIPEGLQLDGNDIRELLFNPQETKRQNYEMLYYGRNGNLEAYTNGQWKLHIEKQIGWPQKNGDFPISLYNLKDDIGEAKNVANDYPEIVNEIKKQMEYLDSQMTNN
uniref:sulfatase family protein n=1 Tax=uncultured Draconibacterium sp. TaxID=1573823 RepID=UPI0032172AFB